MAEGGEGKEWRSLEEQISAMANRLRYFLKKSFALQAADIEDVTQEVLMAAIEAVRREGFQLESNASLSTFVHAIAKHKALDFLKSQRVRKHSPLETKNGGRPIPADDLEHAITDKDLLQKIRKLMKRLPEKESYMLELIYFRGYKVAAVAEEMNLDPTQVSVIKFAAMKKLCRWCEEEGLLTVVAAFLWFTLWRVIYGM